MALKVGNPKNYPIIAIEWADSSSPSLGGWSEPDLLKEDITLYCYSVGFLLKADVEGILICCSYHERSDSDEINALGLLHIPMGAIRKWQVLYKPKGIDELLSELKNSV